MNTLIILPIVGSLAALSGAFIGFRGPFCGAVLAIAAATAWSLT